ncbi:MAG: carboxypeptidase regulatory-like domain-containing protein [Desulfurellaceae bacterium]|nr:carboxypeptidase regulatory-like domain-containing protein [Desulfurellaceae bacterium]
MYRVKYLAVAALSIPVLTLSSAWAYESGDVSNGGTIAGTVKFVGEAPAMAKIETTKDVDVCGKTEKFDEALVVGDGNGVKNVVVSIANIEKGKAQAAEGGTLDQKECIYTPRVVLSPAGADLNILNNDGILHNIHTYSEANPSINKAQPKFRKKMTQNFAQSETIRVECDAHSWMKGWLVVTDHPYYAVTDASGAFELADVPAGSYTLRIWHETLGEMTQDVTVEAGGVASVAVEMAQN